MRLEVIRYNEAQNYHECLDDRGNVRRVDIIVDGSLPEEYAQNPQLLVGKAIQCAWLSAFLEIAQEVRIVDQPKETP